MLNLLFLALACCKSGCDQCDNCDETSGIANSFDAMYPYLEEYYFQNGFQNGSQNGFQNRYPDGDIRNYIADRLGNNVYPVYYEIDLKEYMYANTNAQDGILMIRNVPENQ